MKYYKIPIILALLLGQLYGCGPSNEGDRVIATANGENIFVRDLKRELDLYYKRDPLFKITPPTLEDQLNMIIDRRLLIQKAKQQRLDEKEKFINTIKTFWEQTLIRDLMVYKEEEFGESVSVSEGEVKDYYLVIVKESGELPVEPYEALKEDIRERILGQKIQKLFKEWLDGIKSTADIKINTKLLKGVKWRHEEQE